MVLLSARHPNLDSGRHVLRFDLISATRGRIVVLRPGVEVYGPLGLTGSGEYVRFRTGRQHYVAHIDEFVECAGLRTCD